MSDTKNHKLSDAAIAHIAKLLQMAILTGTDIVDNLRLLRLVPDDDGLLKVDPEYQKNLTASIDKMVEQAQLEGSVSE
jgi:hypothetical protein